MLFTDTVLSLIKKEKKVHYLLGGKKVIGAQVLKKNNIYIIILINIEMVCLDIIVFL